MHIPVGMQTRALFSLAALLVLGSGCESGWDVEGRVTTKDASDKSRPLHVYAVNEESIDLAAVKTGDPSIWF